MSCYSHKSQLILRQETDKAIHIVKQDQQMLKTRGLLGLLQVLLKTEIQMNKEKERPEEVCWRHLTMTIMMMMI